MIDQYHSIPLSRTIMNINKEWASQPATDAVEKYNNEKRKDSLLSSWAETKRLSFFVTSNKFDLIEEKPWSITTSCTKKDTNNVMLIIDSFPEIKWENSENNFQQPEFLRKDKNKRQRISNEHTSTSTTTTYHPCGLHRSKGIRSCLCELQESAMNKQSSYFQLRRCHGSSSNTSKSLFDTLTHVNAHFPMLKDRFDGTSPGFECSMRVVA